MIKITGLEEAQRKLEKMAANAEALDGEHSVKFGDIFTSEFLQEHTKFTSVSDMFAKSGYKADTQEEFAAIPDEPWDAFIKANSSFENWQEMKQAAGVAYAKRKIFEG